MSTVLIKNYKDIPISRRRILRYAGAGDAIVTELLESCMAEAEGVLSYKVCYTELGVKIYGEVADFGVFSVNSKDLARALSGCDSVILFAATVSAGLDRLITKYSQLSPSRALMMQAIGTECIEALCDVFCDDIAEGRALRPRFSPGYGDLSLDVQKDVFLFLDPPKNIGLSLTQGLLMTPTKSVTAFAGIKK